MNDDEIVEYCRRLVVSNLGQYSTPACLNAILDVKHDDFTLYEHVCALKEMFEKCEEILRIRRTIPNDKQRN